MGEKLEPCPFCGGEGEAVYLGEIGRYDHAYVKCYGCSATVEGDINTEGYEPTMQAVRAAWNRRTPQRSIVEPIAQWCTGCSEVRSIECCRADCPTMTRLIQRSIEAELVEALEPFDDALGEDDEFPDDTPVTMKWGRTTTYACTLGDLRRARLARAQDTDTQPSRLQGLG